MIYITNLMLRYPGSLECATTMYKPFVTISGKCRVSQIISHLLLRSPQSLACSTTIYKPSVTVPRTSGVSKDNVQTLYYGPQKVWSVPRPYEIFCYGIQKVWSVPRLCTNLLLRFPESQECPTTRYNDSRWKLYQITRRSPASLK